MWFDAGSSMSSITSCTFSTGNILAVQWSCGMRKMSNSLSVRLHAQALQTLEAPRSSTDLSFKVVILHRQALAAKTQLACRKPTFLSVINIRQCDKRTYVHTYIMHTYHENRFPIQHIPYANALGNYVTCKGPPACIELDKYSVIDHLLRSDLFKNV